MKYSSKGLIGTLLFHLMILLILLFFGFSYPDPPPEELGILVNFGTDETGKGDIEPEGNIVQGGQIEETMPEPVEKAVSETSKTSIPETKVKSVTKVQDTEETAVKISKPTEEEVKEAERKRILAEEQKKIQLEEERKRKIAEQWNTKGQNAFGKKGTGTTTGSEGITEGDGNQGDPDGMPGADNYSDGGGLGNSNFSLPGRRLIGDLPKPNVDGCIVDQKIIIKVEIMVDKEGNVLPEIRFLESTFLDNCIQQAIIKAATGAKFTADPNAAFRQKGWIKYIIEPR